MSNIAVIESLRNFMESNAFDSMSATTQTEMKQRLQQLMEERAVKDKEKLISDFTSVVTPVLLDAGIPVSLIVTYDKDKGVTIKELSAGTSVNVTGIPKEVSESSFGVTFTDGTYIEGENSFDTFLQTLQMIGLSRIPEVDITFGNINLVSAIEKEASKQIAVDGVYVYKELTDNQMMDALQEISDYYYMDIEICTEE